MSKKIKFPVAKVRADGTPAIWLTHTNWLLLRDGIVRKYLDEREGLGRYRTRAEARRKLGDKWAANAHLKHYECLDMWPTWSSDASSLMELFVVGYEAWKHVKGGSIKGWTPESLIVAGDRHELRGREEERKAIGDLSCITARAESVTATADDRPEAVRPGDRSITPATAAVNPGRALETTGQQAA